ncbi:ATP-binding cassette domain-containing protein [Iocasia frigidifontis]|uniref:ATP-binding cassette domain-containing protein n=1 Tax=Iocasia fonsfrigidae TaxID=2682810 RepID=A0A8A7KII0_9FIRM|nr:ATP-binding cassette domain-containing protein [Iocasia fonsfrigidae]QTL99608.1 ATP-binding cassette domain-containing protein [Iocasia fonsfrigidae]
MEDFLLEIQGLTTVNLDGFNLNDINLNLFPGEVHAVVGLGGSGKKTLIEAIAGLVDVKGDIFFKGKPLDFKISLLRNKGIEFIFDTPSVVDELTVAENISLNRYPRCGLLPFINFQGVKNNCHQALDIMELDFDYNMRVGKLSAEEKKNLSIVRAFFNKPEIVIMHEPTDCLGVKSIQRLYNNIYQYKNEGGSIIYITKQWKDALKVADHVSVMFQGEILGTVSEEEARTAPERLVNMMLGNELYNRDSGGVEVENETKKILNTVFKATEFLTSKYELKDVLKLLAEYTTDFMKADACTIKLLDEKTNTIIDTVDYSTNNKLFAELKEEVIFQLTRNDEIFYAFQHDEDFFKLFKGVNGVKTIVVAPVLIRSHVTGIIQVSYRKEYNYSEKEAIYLSTLARQAALAIEDTRLMGRSALLQESHHRIKNNLQYIISLITLQKDFMGKHSSRDISDTLNNIIFRIKSIASVHDLLSKDELGRSIINVKEIVNVIIEFLNTNKVKMILELDDIFISYDKASAIALVINELVSNCLEHAFPENNQGEVKILCCKSRDRIKLIVKDNGKGLPADFKMDELDSLGLSIVFSIVKHQFRGDIKLSSVNGTQVDISIPF